MTKIALWISVVIILAMIGVSLYGLNVIPEDMMIARHWGLDGEPNGYSSRNQILIGLPLMACFLTVLFYFIPKIDPRSDHVRQSQGLLIVGWLGALGLLLLVHSMIILGAAKGEVAQQTPGGVLYLVSLLMVLIGNYTAKSRSNFFLGIRTPWTLSSEHAWSVANRTGGWLFVLTGLAAATANALTGPEIGYRVLLVGVLSAALISVVVSYFAWRGDPERKPAPGGQ